MAMIKLIFACCILVSFTSATYYYRRPIAYSKLDVNSEGSQLTEQHATGKASGQSGSNVNKENGHKNTGVPNFVDTGSNGLPLYSTMYLVPVREEQGGHNGGAFGAFGSLVIPGLNLNLGGGNGFGGSLSASGGLSGNYGPNHGGHYGGHYGGIGGAHAGGVAGFAPVHYGYPHYGYASPYIGGAGGYAAAGAFSPFYAGAHGIHHIKASETSGGVSGVVNLAPNGHILGGITPQRGNNYQEKQPDVSLEVSPYQQEGESFEQSVLPPGFHHPGFIASSAGRLGYPVVMASPEQLQELSLRQNPNPSPFAQFFQRPFQFLQMFVRPQNQANNNSSKQPEKPSTEKPVVESPPAVRPSPEKPVEANGEKPSVSQSHGSEASANKNQGAQQNVTDNASPQKTPSGSGDSATVSAGQNEDPKTSAVSDIIASVNEVVKATSDVEAGSDLVLPVFIDEGITKARAVDDGKAALDSAKDDVADASVNAVPNDESAVDIESKPIA